MPVVELSEVRTYLNFKTGDHDAEVRLFIEAAESLIAERVGGHLEPGDEVTITKATREGTLLLPHPVVSLVAVVDESETELELDTLTAVGGVVARTPECLSGTLTVTYAPGFNPVPAHIKLAVLETVRHLWQTQRGTSAARRGPGASDSAADTLPGAENILPFRVQQLIARHEFPTVA